jgi:transcriptional regulator with XRE-family HTH domain
MMIGGMNPASGDARAKRVGAAIRRRRQVLDLEQQELAGLVGVHVNTVQKWENGTHYPGRKLGKLEAVLGVSLDDDAPEPDILPDGLRDDIREAASTPERAAHLEALFEAFARGEELPVSRKRRAGR